MILKKDGQRLIAKDNKCFYFANNQNEIFDQDALPLKSGPEIIEDPVHKTNDQTLFF